MVCTSNLAFRSQKFLSFTETLTWKFATAAKQSITETSDAAQEQMIIEQVDFVKRVEVSSKIISLDLENP